MVALVGVQRQQRWQQHNQLPRISAVAFRVAYISMSIISNSTGLLLSYQLAAR
jgi:hypothetical protein